MARIALRVEECCAWCRRPVNRCTDSSCDDAPTYAGILVRGEWTSVTEKSATPSLEYALAQ